MSVDFTEFSRKMDRTLEHLGEDFDAVRAGRANAKVLDRISVEYYGSETPLNGVATISSPDARTLVITPWDTKLLKEIQKAIQMSDLYQPPERWPGHPPDLPPADGGAQKRAVQAGQEVRRGCQGRYAKHPPGRHGLRQEAEKEQRDHRGRPEEGREGPAGPDR